MKNDIAVHIESWAYNESKKVEKIQIENFHEFLRDYTDIVSSVVTMHKSDLIPRIKDLIEEGISKRIYKIPSVKILET